MIDLATAQVFAEDFKKMKCFSPLAYKWIDEMIKEIIRLKKINRKKEKLFQALLELHYQFENALVERKTLEEVEALRKECGL